MKTPVNQKKDDPRVGDLINAHGTKNIDVGILGLPFDLGVKFSGGRVGAKDAPAAIRGTLRRYGTAYNLERKADISKLIIADLGDAVIVKDSCEKTHRSVFNTALEAFNHVSSLITLGGGNDLSYATIKSLAHVYGGNIGGVNIDAHFDVRPVADGKYTSGTPYRRLLEEKILNPKNFFEFAAQGHVNAREHYIWLKKEGVDICFLADARKKGIISAFREGIKRLKNCEALFVSLDIDAVSQAFAPGSSAPNPDGLFPEDVLTIAFLAGQNTRVRLFEIMEVNPRYDVDGRTVRLSANIINEFLAGFSVRE